MATALPLTDGDPRIVLERNRRLSQSLLWQFQRTFFARHGIGAWARGVVPSYITSNPFIAQAYARVVFGYLRDWAASTASPLDSTQPVYIIELGAGSGRFAYHFLKRLLGILARSSLKDLPVRYVMTDFAERTLRAWQQHPWLLSLAAQGHLDFALYDAEQPAPLCLVRSGIKLAPGMITNPIVVLANYFFDSIPQDAFTVADGRLHESLVTISSPPGPDLGDPDLLKRFKLSYHDQPASADYYDDPHFNRILRAYLQRGEGTTFLFPTGALRVVSYFRKLAGGRLLLLSADKGYSREDDLRMHGRPGLALHGSFSLMVNYHAIGAYVLNQGGRVLHPAHRPTSLTVAAYLLGWHPTGYLETTLAYAQAIEQGGPDDFFALKRAVEPHYAALSLEQILAYLRLSGWDSNIFLGCLPRVHELLDAAPAFLRHELHKAVGHVWATHYPLGDGQDLALSLGLLLMRLRCDDEALEYFQHSLQIYGPQAPTYYNMAVCHRRLGHRAAALAYLDKTLARDPAFGPATDLRRTLVSAVGAAS